MKRVIHKYEMTVCEQTIEIPEEARFVHLGTQNSLPVMWWSVPSNCAQEGEIERHFAVIGMGQDYDDAQFHVGTVQIGELVWHVFTDREFLREYEDKW